MPPIVLASKSPRRKEFLLKLGIKFEVVNPPTQEEKRKDGEKPADYALRLAYNKADVIARGRPPGALVLAADTIVVLDDEIYGQPKDNDDAKRMLRALSGRTHEVLTA